MQPTQQPTVASLVASQATVYFDIEVPHIPKVYQPKRVTYRGKLMADLHNGWFEVAVDEAYPSFDLHVWIDNLRTTPLYKAGDRNSNLSLMEPSDPALN